MPPAPGKSMDLNAIERSLLDAGLTPRGAFHPGSDDGVPPLAANAPARTVVLAGNAGPRMWRVFGGAMTLDEWSRRVLTALALRLGAHAVFPFERPYLPFQRWAMRAEACHASPLGLLIHPDYGVWHGYRGALLFAAAIALPPPDRRASPCASCVDRPCLSACPARHACPIGRDYRYTPAQARFHMQSFLRNHRPQDEADCGPSRAGAAADRGRH